MKLKETEELVTDHFWPLNYPSGRAGSASLVSQSSECVPTSNRRIICRKSRKADQRECKCKSSDRPTGRRVRPETLARGGKIYAPISTQSWEKNAAPALMLIIPIYKLKQNQKLAVLVNFLLANKPSFRPRLAYRLCLVGGAWLTKAEQWNCACGSCSAHIA